MVTIVNLKGMEEFSNYADKIGKDESPVLFCFTGEKLPSGLSWCSDCVEFVKNMPLSSLGQNVKTEYFSNYEEFTSYIDKLSEKHPDTFFLFTGKKKENGRSWCMYCQIAEPVVQAFLTEIKRKIIFAYVDVGDRDTWKDKNCPFRTDKRTKLMVIPTIIRWNGVQRLEGSQCSKRELLQMLIEEDED